MTACDGHDEHLEPDLDDEDAMPGPNFLAQFRRPLTEEELDEVARDLEQAIVAWLAETDAMFSGDQTGAESPAPASNEV